MAEAARESGDAELAALPEIDTSKPHSSRMYDYAIGGKNHFAADRAAFAVVAERSPNARTGMRANREFLARATRYLAAEAGIRQFLDIGSGLPATNNVHEVAQADMRDPASVLTDPVVKDILDLSQPTGLMLSAVLHFLVEDDAPRAIIETLLDALPSGSYLVASHATAEHDPETVASGTCVYNQGGIPLQMRDSDVFARLAFDGLDLIPPGVVLVSEWRPDPDDPGPRPAPAEVNAYGGIGRKPSPIRSSRLPGICWISLIRPNC